MNKFELKLFEIQLSALKLRHQILGSQLTMMAKAERERDELGRFASGGGGNPYENMTFKAAMKKNWKEVSSVVSTVAGPDYTVSAGSRWTNKTETTIEMKAVLFSTKDDPPSSSQIEAIEKGITESSIGSAVKSVEISMDGKIPMIHVDMDRNMMP